MARKRAFAHERQEAGKPRLQRAEAEAARDDLSPVQGQVLRLQRDGGNEAVVGVLARKTRPGELDSDKKRDLPTGEKRPQSVHMEGVGDFKLLALTRNENDLQIIIPGDSAGIVELQKRMSDGRPIDTVTIDLGGLSLTLKDVYIGNLTYGGPGKDASSPVTLTLNYRSIKSDSDTP